MKKIACAALALMLAIGCFAFAPALAEENRFLFQDTFYFGMPIEEAEARAAALFPESQGFSRMGSFARFAGPIPHMISVYMTPDIVYTFFYPAGAILFPG